mgnify:CR=1 FL=1|jgi:LPXTG-motif cell wall-anchored protein
MKKLIATIAIVLSMGMTLTAQVDENMYETKGSLFGLGQNIFTNADDEMFLPYGYEEEDVFVPETFYGMDNNGDAGLFGLGNNGVYGTNRGGGGLILPSEHGSTGDSDAPLGTGIAVLTALSAAYLVGKKRKE